MAFTCTKMILGGKYVPPTYSIDYLVVAGGGGAGSSVSVSGNKVGAGAGGGAGGALQGTYDIEVLTSYTIIVGSGGTKGTGPVASFQTANAGTNGSNSSISIINATAIGGGRGYGLQGQNGGTGGNPYYAAGSGGSGGGGGIYWPQFADYRSPGSGTSEQGYSGGTNQSLYLTGGGGGAAGVGTNSNETTFTSGNGGPGLNWKSLGTFYAGGGGGAINGLGGSGGGGNGEIYPPNLAGQNGAENTGGGGGGGYLIGAGNGGKGIVIIRYSGSQRGTGGTITSSDGYTYHKFLTSGTFTA